MSKYAIRICGGDYGLLDRRDPCASTLHNWPLPAGYVDAAEMAASRLAHGWGNPKCPDCGLYGWTPGQFKGTAAESVEVKVRP
ncbi:hypothetical protein SAMN04490240_4089 [Rhodococcus pyridinivorans]|nr:hypothetical protein SAMN04490240_4089 [Rhodococcus pyridinivorans]